METRPVAGLRAALPYLKHFRDQLFVVKCGGETLQDRDALESLVEQIALLHQLGIKVILVHGGGDQATKLGESLGVESKFVDGRRVTSPEFVDVMVMALNGQSQAEILSVARQLGIGAVGISGITSGLIRAEKRPPVNSKSGELLDYGQVGDIQSVDPTVVQVLLDGGLLPIISPISADDQGVLLNINADQVASALAVALGAAKLIVVTTPRGILADIRDPQSLISQLNLAELTELEESGSVADGMWPKSAAIRAALAGGVASAHVISYRFPDALLTEIFTNEGCGTMICLNEPAS